MSEKGWLLTILDMIYGAAIDETAKPDTGRLSVGFHRPIGSGYNTQEFKMEFLERYKTACMDAVNDPELVASDLDLDGDLDTKCNFGVQQICGEMGYDGFMRKTANQIYSLLIVDDNWVRSSGKVCAEKLRAGAVLSIAAIEGGLHGHVAMLYPGDLGASGKWSTQEVPLVANVGKKNGVMFANYAFGDEPTYFYREME